MVFFQGKRYFSNFQSPARNEDPSIPGIPGRYEKIKDAPANQ
jgi:hypothetical protein